MQGFFVVQRRKFREARKPEWYNFHFTSEEQVK